MFRVFSHWICICICTCIIFCWCLRTFAYIWVVVVVVAVVVVFVLFMVFSCIMTLARANGPKTNPNSSNFSWNQIIDESCICISFAFQIRSRQAIACNGKSVHLSAASSSFCCSATDLMCNIYISAKINECLCFCRFCCWHWPNDVGVFLSALSKVMKIVSKIWNKWYAFIGAVKSTDHVTILDYWYSSFRCWCCWPNYTQTLAQMPETDCQLLYLVCVVHSRKW